MLRRDSSQRSFFDQTLYDRLIESDHFLRRLDGVIDFGFVHRVCRSCYSREVGRPAASPVMLFKMMLLQFLYDISDRRIVEEVRYHMAFKWFCGLEVDGEPPHPTTLTRFRARLGPERFARIHNRIVHLARERGLVSDRLSVVDATHVEARMNSYKVDDEDPPDPDARRGGRGGGKTFVGYKAHLALDADSRIITREGATPANVHEGQRLPEVLEINARRVTADKAYDSNRNHHLLANRNIHSAIILKRNRLCHPLGGKRSDRWVQDDQRKRRRIEPKMAELKHLHGLVRARYWTLPKMKIQLHLAVIAANVKRIVMLLFRGAIPPAAAPGHA
jgi:transposase